MSDKLAAIVLGNRRSGKSRTWNTLFQRTVKTGSKQRELYFNAYEYSSVFLVSASPEERGEYVGNIITGKGANIVLCSLQYHEDVDQSFQYFRSNGFRLFVQWLNPGYSDASRQADDLSLMPTLLDWGATVSMADGRKSPEPRVREIRNYIYGWAKPRGLVSEYPNWW